MDRLNQKQQSLIRQRRRDDVLDVESITEEHSSSEKSVVNITPNF